MITEHSIFHLRRSYVPGMRLGLEPIKTFLTALGSPHLKYPRVLIAGTNGKGSTATFLSHLCRACGMRTALFTSPHLRALNERFRINGEEITDLDLLQSLKKLEVVARKEKITPTFFETMSALAHDYFFAQEVDLAVLEVGLGGRLDATNIGSFALNILTDISMDHTEHLGEDVEKIAFEKAATISPNGLVVSALQDPPVMKVIQKEVDKKGANLFLEGRDFFIERKEEGICEFQFQNNPFISFKLPCLPYYQTRNLSLALASLFLLQKTPMEASVIEKVIRDVDLPSRFQIIEKKSLDEPTVILDGAHNPSAMRALVLSLFQIGGLPKNLHMILGIKADKDWRGMLAELPKGMASLSLVGNKANTDLGIERFVNPKELKTHAQRMGLSTVNQIKEFNHIKDAYQAVFQKASKEDFLVVTGSFYLMAPLYKFFQERRGV